MHHSAHILLIAFPMCSMSVLACAANSATPGPSGAPTAASASASSEAQRVKQLEELDVGERMIEVAAGDCASACGGLDRITKACAAICSPSAAGNPACANARDREASAKKRVSSFCDPCGGF